jgi:replication initiator protein
VANHKHTAKYPADPLSTFPDLLSTKADQLSTFSDTLSTFQEMNGKKEIPAKELMLSNSLVTAKWDVQVHELRLLLLALTKISPENLSCEVTAKEYSAVWNVPLENTYKYFRRIAKSLATRVISFENDEIWHDLPVVQRGSGVKYSGRMWISFNSLLAPLFTGLSNRFFKVSLRQLRKLDTAPGIRFYMLVKTIFDTEFFSMELSNFQQSLGTKYKRKDDLIRRIVKPEIKKIAATDIKLVLLKSSPGRIKFRILRNDHESCLVREFGFKPKNAKALICEVRKCPDWEDYVDACLGYCRENLDNGIIRSNVVNYVRKYILEDYRPQNPKALLARTKETNAKKQSREQLRKERERENAEEHYQKDLATFAKKYAGKDIFSFLEQLNADPELDGFFKKALLEPEIQKSPGTIYEVNIIIQRQIIDCWKKRKENKK